ncbi:MAG TPA: bifunctional diguanylate cyclase/phosphodiesterase [Candidatus Dormibacteraeota bacterium]|nr:bifunctional diguanylate cyclase/phosphodiesterase [Candidatus Dormibacteraeota bacterium]
MLRSEDLILDVLEEQLSRGRADEAPARDRLTGLLSRDALLARLDRSLARAAAQPRSGFALLLLDLDRFKLVNHAYGHEAGDELLRQVGARLRAVSRATDAVLPATRGNSAARLGGDEFVVVLEQLARREEAHALACRLLGALAADYWIQGTRVTVSASIGIVHSDGGYRTAGELLRDADAAMDAAKTAGRGRCVAFDTSMGQRVRLHVDTERELRAALERQQLALVYQPIVSLHSGTMAGIEALVRWQHPAKGTIPPAQFLPVAVDSGLIKPLGEWVMQRACRDFVRLRRQMGAGAPGFVSVNVSRQQLVDPSLPARLEETLRETTLEPQYLHLEITESELVTDFAIARQTLESIKGLGVALSVDDFGTGYSSLASLHEFPIDFFKLDKSFMASSMRSAQGPALIAVAHAMILLARNINVRVIAEGVETAEQLALLQSLQCDMAQGYFLGRPMPIEAVASFRIPTRGRSEG